MVIHPGTYPKTAKSKQRLPIPQNIIKIPDGQFLDSCKTIISTLSRLIARVSRIARMDAPAEFDIHESLRLYKDEPLTVPTPEADAALIDCEHDPESLTSAVVNSVLNPIVDAVAENPDAIGRAGVLDSLQFLLKCASVSLLSDLHTGERRSDSALVAYCRHSAAIPATALSKILDLVVSGISTEAEIVHNDLEAEEQEVVQSHKRTLEILGFLLQWTLAAIDSKAASEKASAPAARKGAKGTKAKASSTKDTNWDPTSQIQNALETMSKVMKVKLSKIFVTTSERDTFINLFTRPVYLLLENETRIKSTAMRMHCFKVLCIAVKHYGQANGELKRKTVIVCADVLSHSNLDRPVSVVL